jgi:HEPN domain-containing protein
MNALVREWLEKAEGDYATALREYRARKSPNYDAAGFHAQQCVEKYLKAVLQKNKKPFSKIHDLLSLLELCRCYIPELEIQKELLAFLNQFSVLYRYPGESANCEQAKKAVSAMKSIVRIIKASQFS